MNPPRRFGTYLSTFASAALTLLAGFAHSAETTLDVNDGSPDRSRVKKMTLQVPPGRALVPSSLRIHALASQDLLDPSSFTLTLDADRYILRFPDLPGDALADGNYLLSLLTRPTAGGDARSQDVFPLHAWFGDQDGDRDVDFLDTSFFWKTWNLSSAATSFDARFDYNADGAMNGTDLLPLQNNYFHILPPAAAVSAYLAIDDGDNKTDAITSDPAIHGDINFTSAAGTLTLRADVRRANAAAPDPVVPYPSALTGDMTSATAFALPEARLQALNGAALEAGAPYLFRVQLVTPGNSVVARDSVPFTITPGRGNMPPQLVAPGNRLISPDIAFSTTIFAVDPDPGDTLTFSVDSGPSGLTINAATGRLDWPAPVLSPQPHVINLRVEDQDGASDITSFAITVEQPETPTFAGTAPTISVPENDALLVGETFAEAVTATDPDTGDVLTFSLPQAPSGMTIDPVTGAVSWTPVAGQTGPQEITARVTDSSGLSDFGTFVVTPGLPNRGPVAVDDIFTTPKGVTTTIPAIGVLTNDTDPDNSPLTAELVSGPRNGTLALRPDGSFDYTPGTGTAPFSPELAFGFNELNGGDYKINDFSGSYDGGNVTVADLDSDGKPEILAIGTRNAGIQNVGWLVALKLDEATQTFSPIWTYHDVGMLRYSGEPAVGDVTGDGIPEVVVGTNCAGQFTVFSNTGEILTEYRNDTECLSRYGSTPEIVDLDGDGLAEIVTVLGNSVRVNSGIGEVIWERQASGTNTNGQNRALIADVDLDGELNIYHGGILYDAHGNELWRLKDQPSRINDWAVAAVNLDDDPFAEIVKLEFRPPVLRVIEHDGSCKWVASSSGNPPSGSDCVTPVPMPTTQDAKSLIVADLNGDGQSEILLGTSIDTSASGNFVTVFNRDGSILWQAEATIGSKVMSKTNVAAFDFTGDGIMEIVVSGQGGTCFLSGADGSKLYDIPWDDENPGRTSAGGQLNPIVADLENDGHAELIIAGRDTNIDANAGIFVYKDAADNWMPARSVWNQARYYVTNVNADGSIPLKPLVNWLTPGLNNYGVNVPMPDESSSTDSFAYRISDGEFTSNVATVTLEIGPENKPPVILSTPSLAAVPEYAYNYPIFATDPNIGDEVTLKFLHGPAGMTFEDSTRLSWTPTAADLGEHAVTIAAEDRKGAITLQNFTLHVIPAQAVPDVVGQTQAVALVTIDGAGFTGGKISREDHPTVSAGLVISQLPLAGASEIPGTAVALLISNGPGPGYTDGDGDGYTPNQGDCDDTNPNIHPGAPDPEGDGIDQDCDGIDGKLTLASILVEPGNSLVLTNQNVPLTATGIFTDGTSQNLTAVVTWSGGVPRFSSATAGSFTVTATEGTISGFTTITVVDQVADAAPPLALITSPTSGTTVTEPIDILGSASDSNFLKYELAYAPAGTEDFTIFASGNNPVTADSLGKFDPTVLINDQYTIRLTVYDQGRNRSTAETTVIVDGDFKVGNFSLAFTDLEIPMAGIPLAVTRIYDSRDKSKGDFGVGWTMGFRSIRISTNRIPGSGWSVAHSGLAFALQKTDEHIVTITHPDGHVEEFDLVVSPDVSPIVPFPVSIITANFKPRPGTMGRLEAIGNNTLSIFDPQPGPASLLDDTTLEIYNPQRFRYTDHDGNVIILHKVNGVESITDLNGNSVRFTPNGIFHSAGRSVAFTRDNSGRIVKITDPNGAEQSYSYDANGDLRVHEDADANRTRIAYNRTHGLIRIEDPTGNIGIRTEYDDDGRLIATIDAAGHRTDFIRDMAAREESVRDAKGNIQRFRYDEDGNVLSSERSVTSEGVPVVVRELFEHDARGNQTAHVDADGVRSTYEYDMMDRIVRTVVDPDGLAIISSTNYDAEGNVIAQTDPVGNINRFTYGSRRNIQSFTNAAGAINRYEFDEKGQAVSSTDIFGARTAATFDSSGRPVQQDTFEADSSLLSRIQYTYDSNGNELTRTTFKTRNGVLTPCVTTYAYDATGRRIRTTDPEEGISQTEYDSRGLVSATVDALDRRTEFEYDLRSQLVETRYPDGTTEQKTYDFKGRLLTESDASGRITRHEYDELGREIRVILPDGSALKNIWSPAGRLIASIDARENRTDFDYDSAGRRVGTRLPQVTDATTGGAIRPVITSRLNAGGRVIGLKDANGNETIFTLNALGKISRTVNPDGTSRDATFDVGGRMLSATDELGRVTSFSYDSLGRLREVKQPRPDPATAPSVTRYDYDLDGRQISRTDALGKITRYDYDKLGRRVRRTLPSGVYENSEFDAVGNEIRYTAFDGKVSTVTYDARNRGVVAIDGDGVERRIQYTDSGDRQSISDSGGTTSYAYDAMDRITLVTNPNGESLEFTWDGSGNRTSVDSPSGKTTYGYDAANRLIRVASPDGVTLQGYDPNGNEVSVIRPNGTKTLSTINSMNRVTSVEHRTASDEVLAFFNSTFASNGQRLSVAEVDGSVESYRYDGMGRLISEQRVGTSPRNLDYEYDAVGNRTARNRDGIIETYSYGTDDQLLRAGTKFYTYDANGNRTSKMTGSSTTRYVWNSRNRLSTASMAGSAINFSYDADGNRIGSDSNATSRDFLLDTVTPDNLSRVLVERDHAGLTLATFDYGNRLLSVDRGGVRQILTDPHGSTRLTTGAGGMVENPLTYEAFGVQRSGDISSEIEHLFAGEQFDPATGLYYLRARYYDPETGVFLSRDPHEGDDVNPQTQSPYTYASNDPINLIDPSGQFSLTELSISNAIQNSLNALRISANFCNSLGRARGVAGAISLISTMLAGQSGGFDGNTFDFSIVNTAPTRPLGSKIKKIGIEAKTKSNPLSLSAGATFEFQGGLPAIKIGVEASAKNIKFDFSAALGDEFDLFDVTSCGFVYLRVKGGHEDSVGYTYSAETGHGIKVSTKFFFKIQSLLGIKTEVPFLGVEGIRGSKKSSGVITLPGNFQIPF